MGIGSSLEGEKFDAYLEHLRWLVNQPSPFTEPEKPAALIAQLLKRFQALLPAYRFRIDRAGNLVGTSDEAIAGEPTLYLSAHADTVPFEPELWTPPFAPYPAWEDANEIVAQGVSDCKAGVAAQLWLAQLAGAGECSLRNVVFTVTLKEEGGGLKTAAAIGEEMGKSLPAPLPGSTLLVLENTVTSGAPYLPGVFSAENGSYVVQVEGSLPELRQLLVELPSWRPVAIVPIGEGAAAAEFVVTGHRPLGHVSTAAPEANPLRGALLAATDGQLLKAGDERSPGTVPASVGVAVGSMGARHRLTMAERGHTPLERVEAQLAGRVYRALKPLKFSSGFDASSRVTESVVGREFLAAEQRGEVGFGRNPGASDATMITASVTAEQRAALLPLVCGPGTRSQREASPPRLTHGPNETLVKAAAARSLGLIWTVLLRSGHVVRS